MPESQGLFVGLIPDGNRRWASKHGKSPIEGHREGAECVKRIFERARDMMIVRILAAWGLSCKNVDNRPPDQLTGLYMLMESTLEDLRDNWMDRLENKNIRMVHMGRRDRMENDIDGRDVLARLDEIHEHTRDRTGMIIALCLDYDGLNERDRALTLWRINGARDDETSFLQHLDLPRQGIPFQPVNLVIRTGEDGNRSAGARMHHTNEFLHEYREGTEDMPHDTFLPNYTPDNFAEDIQSFRKMQRRRGA